MLLKGEPDAATGHRGLPIRLMNFSEEPCVIEGYPDVAFGDQNQHLLAVTVEQGGSFMAQDPGPQRIEVPAGGYAVTVLGWDAASPHGALVTKTVYAAPTAGMTRGSWPIDLDIVEGSTVAITAWAIDSEPCIRRVNATQRSLASACSREGWSATSSSRDRHPQPPGEGHVQGSV